MSLRKVFIGMGLGATGGAALSAGVGALSGSVGAAIMNSAGHAGYAVTEATQMGAVGGAVLGGGSGLIVGAGLGGELSSSKEVNKKSSESICSSLLAYTGGAVIGGLTGFGIMKAAGSISIMGLGETAASFAIGGAVTMIPASVAILCIALPLALCAVACIKEEETPRPRV